VQLIPGADANMTGENTVSPCDTISDGTPLVSVIMSCYREPLDWLSECIDSVLAQTMADFEFVIIIDDPVNLALIEKVRSYDEQDMRIKLLINEVNVGLAVSLNRGISESSAEIIARMDADDIAEENRLQTQLDFLEVNPKISLVGSAIKLIDEQGSVIGRKSYYSDETLLKKIIPYSSVTCHPTWMFRKSLHTKIGGYRDLFTAQDYDFLYRVLDAGEKISNIQSCLLRYRVHQQSITGGFSLNRYKVRHYIHKMHNDRLRLGQDNFDKSTLNEYLQDTKGNSKVSDLLAKLRRTKKYSFIKKLYYLTQLFLYSKDIRERVYDHLKLKCILATRKEVKYAD
jgi:glycosyltransferase involved in cell wall biosynthesis